MDIQQQEKESLAAYVHRFKMKAKRCNLTNDATTIRIFIEGLKNAHSLATCIYEKGQQMLTDTISEVEKFNVAQQLTFHSQCNVKQRRLLFLVLGTRTHCMTLPSY